MPEYEYHQIDLNTAPPKGNALTLLNEAGKDGWLLVTITQNFLAYFVRQVPAEPEPPPARRKPRGA